MGGSFTGTCTHIHCILFRVLGFRVERKLANRAQELLREMQDEGIEPDVYTYTADRKSVV